jgi:hypothetical protein
MESEHERGRRSAGPLGSRVGVALLLAVAVGVAATVFGIGYAPEAHHAESGGAEAAGEHMEAEEESDEHAEGEAAEHAEEEESGASAGAVVSAILISLAGAAVALLATARGYGRVAVALLSIGAAVIHFAVVSEHFDEWWLTGTFFLALGVFQLVWALLVLFAPSPLLYLAGAVANALVVVLWIVSRTSGVPVGPEAGNAEPVALPDSLATAFEVVLVAILLLLLGGRTTAQTSRALGRPAAIWVSAAIVAALTALALVSVA